MRISLGASWNYSYRYLEIACNKFFTKKMYQGIFSKESTVFWFSEATTIFTFSLVADGNFRLYIHLKNLCYLLENDY